MNKMESWLYIFGRRCIVFIVCIIFIVLLYTLTVASKQYKGYSRVTKEANAGTSNEYRAVS